MADSQLSAGEPLTGTTDEETDYFQAITATDTAFFCICSVQENAYKLIDEYTGEWRRTVVTHCMYEQNVSDQDFDDIHVPLKMYCYHFGDHVTFHLAPSSAQNFFVQYFYL